MTERMNLGSLAREAYRGMAALDRFVAASPLPSSLVHLVNLRASQINGCVYCVDMHSADAKKEGESDARLHAVAVWREAPFFTERERAALAFAEAATRLSTDDVTDAVWNEAAAHFSEAELAALVVAVAAINAWNRMGVSTRMTPESYQP
ncbi:carboxymuconolactone decarboxylase family protein [Nonomuraea sp. LP-02]|uniref:carboxymuconolactone decarboxylase family protein n=1 Tax=Nonomuraea sp. LP-02 TaxID=3097960 RepID=UPI002E329B78|nr:carboxymuconolactone decarboxylase family protein [Nonomuraea sp. LP-02]MED7928674.1 carboxymuconolactone decarboxylase family protein [Nonomuraea sp. LP-02]